MWSLKALGVIYGFDAAGYTAALKRYVEDQTRLGAAEFAQEALARIPVRTGFVAGSFGSLVDLLGSKARFNPIVAFIFKEYYYPPGGGRIRKTTTSGRRFATPQDQVFKWSSNTFIFQYEVDITYFSLNDTQPGHAPTAPWGVFAAAQKAFEAFMANMGINYNVQLQNFSTFKPIP